MSEFNESIKGKIQRRLGDAIQLRDQIELSDLNPSAKSYLLEVNENVINESEFAINYLNKLDQPVSGRLLEEVQMVARHVQSAWSSFKKAANYLSQLP